MKYKNQKGMSIVGIIAIIVVILSVVLLMIRVAPVFTEYRTITRVVKYAADGRSENEIKNLYTQQLRLDGVSNPSVTDRDLNIKITGRGATVSFKYEREIGLFGDTVFLLFKLQGSQTVDHL